MWECRLLLSGVVVLVVVRAVPGVVWVYVGGLEWIVFGVGLMSSEGSWMFS